MALVISADGQKLAAQKGTPFWTSATEFSTAVRVKITTAQWGNLFGICDFDNAAYNTAPLRTAAGTNYDYGLRLQGNDRRMDGVGTVGAGWDLVVLTYKQNGSRIAYVNGSPVMTVSANMDVYWAGGVGFNYACFGIMPYDGSNARAKIAHGAVWNKELTAAEVAALYNGGAGGAGKNPTTVAAANLVFYAPLTSDASVSVGGVTLTATGSPTFDSGDNPNVEATGGGGGSTHNVTIASSTQANHASSVAISQATVAGTLVSAKLGNNTGTTYPNTSNWTAEIKNSTTGELVVRLTGLTTDSASRLTMNHASIVAGTAYAIEPIHPIYGRALPVLTAT